MHFIRRIRAFLTGGASPKIIEGTVDDLALDISFEEIDGACTSGERRPCGDCDCAKAAVCPQRISGRRG